MRRKKMTEEEKRVLEENGKRQMEEQEKTDPWFHDIEKEKRNEMWFWCMHCQECFQGKEALRHWDEGDEFFSCPNVWEKQKVRCNGSPIDWHSWESFRKQTKEYFGVEYPLIPEKGKTYLMYPEEIPQIRNYRGDFPNHELPG